MVVGGNLLHPEQRMAIRFAVSWLEPPLVGQKRLALHEKHRENAESPISAIV